jgi:hypothetical protein
MTLNSLATSNRLDSDVMRAHGLVADPQAALL